LVIAVAPMAAEPVVEVKASSHGQADPPADTAVDANVLLATELPRRGVADNARCKLAAPQDLVQTVLDRSV
jgi:hypothetical protein